MYVCVPVCLRGGRVSVPVSLAVARQCEVSTTLMPWHCHGSAFAMELPVHHPFLFRTSSTPTFVGLRNFVQWLLHGFHVLSEPTVAEPCGELVEGSFI